MVMGMMRVESEIAELNRGERWGWAVPLVCAAHCLGAPVLLVLAPTLATSVMLEGALMMAACFFVIPGVVGGVQLHRRVHVWWPVGFGAGLWGVELSGLADPVPGTVLTVSGSLLLAGGVVWNSRLRRRVSHACSCPAHPE